MTIFTSAVFCYCVTVLRTDSITATGTGSVTDLTVLTSSSSLSGSRLDYVARHAAIIITAVGRPTCHRPTCHSVSLDTWSLDLVSWSVLDFRHSKKHKQSPRPIDLHTRVYEGYLPPNKVVGTRSLWPSKVSEYNLVISLSDIFLFDVVLAENA